MFSVGIASCSRSIRVSGSRSATAVLRNTLPLPKTRTPLRGFTSGSQTAARQALGRITPKRIAIPISPGGGIPRDASLPTPSIWRPIIVSTKSSIPGSRLMRSVLLGIRRRRLYISCTVYERRYAEMVRTARCRKLVEKRIKYGYGSGDCEGQTARRS